MWYAGMNVTVKIPHKKEHLDEAKSAGGFIRSTICSQKLLAFQCVSCMYVVTIVIVCCDYCDCML